MNQSFDDAPAAPKLTRRRAVALLGLAVGATACRNDQQAASPTDPPTATTEPSNGESPLGTPSPISTSTTALTTNPSADTAGPTTLAPTIACEDTDEPTVETTEGPFFSTGSPERSSLVEPGDEGTPFTLSGVVTDPDCAALGRAKIELWQAGPTGEYDNSGFRYRGHFFTADDGTFTVETLKAGLYPGRTRHFHVMVQPTGGRVLTTQLFWPDEDGNADDGIFDATLVMDVARSATSESGTFHFVV